MGIRGLLIESVCDVALAAVLYVLLKPVNVRIALFGALFICWPQPRLRWRSSSSTRPRYWPQLAKYLEVFSSDQRHALMLLSLKLYSAGRESVSDPLRCVFQPI